MAAEENTRECPFCREEIKADAIRCKHCRSPVSPLIPPHGGTCPYCREEIKPDAVKCKHCGSMVGNSAETDCGPAINLPPSFVFPRMPTPEDRKGPLDLGGLPPLTDPGVAAREKKCTDCVSLGGISSLLSGVGVRQCCQKTLVPIGQTPDGRVILVEAWVCGYEGCRPSTGTVMA